MHIRSGLNQFSRRLLFQSGYKLQISPCLGIEYAARGEYHISGLHTQSLQRRMAECGLSLRSESDRDGYEQRSLSLLSIVAECLQFCL